MRIGAPPCILLVDDEPTVLEAQRLTLEANGFVCHVATNGVEALEALRKISVDVVISDLRMPIMSGFDLLPNIRRQYPRIVLIICSAEPGEDLQWLNLPAAAFLQKGAYTSEQLVSTVEWAMRSHPKARGGESKGKPAVKSFVTGPLKR